MATTTNGVKNRVKKELEVELVPMDLRELMITVQGDSPLICNKWSEKAKKQILDKHMKKAKQPREAKDPEKDYHNSLYHLPGGKYGFPSLGFKGAAVTAVTQIDWMTKVKARGAFHVVGEMVEIKGTPRMREDMVRLQGMGSPPDIRYRGEFPEWECEFTVRYNASVISAEQLVNLFNLAGFAVGLGEWRPEKDGNYGMFHIKREDKK